MENVRHYHEKKSYGPADWRRMIYMTKVRQEREHVFGAFDCPDASMVVAKTKSIHHSPAGTQLMLNSRFIMQQAGLFAETADKRSQRMIPIESDWHGIFASNGIQRKLN